MYLTTSVIKQFILPEIIQSFKFLNSNRKLETAFKSDRFFHDYNISCKVFCLTLNTEQVRSETSKCAFIQQINEEISTNIALDPKKQAIFHENVVAIALAIICADSDATLRSIAFSIHEYDKSFHMQLSIFMQKLRMIYIGYVSSENKREKCLTFITEFLHEIASCIAEAHRNALENCLIFKSSTPSYITTTLRNRIYMCMLLPDQDTVVHFVHTLTFPRNFLIECPTSKESQSVNFIQFRQIMQYIPAKNPLTIDCIDLFEKYIWKMHSFSPIEFNKKFPNYKHSKLELTFTAAEIFAQAIAFSLPNWKEIWFYMQWPCTPEIVRRLNFLKEETSWQLNVKQIVLYLLSFK